MKSHVAAIALLGSVVASPADVSDYKAALGPATYCITYESTYLAPISIGANSSEADASATDEPGFLPSDSATLLLSELTQEAFTTGASVNTEDPAVNTEDPTVNTEGPAINTDDPAANTGESTVITETLPVDTDQPTLTTIAPEDTEEPSLPTESTATQPVFEPTGQRVIFLVQPAGELTKRDVGGFVGSGNPDVCTFASTYTLGKDQLFVGNFPISYSGEDFQSLDSVSAPLEGAITKTFSSEGGVLSFANRGLPGGRASFCQDPLDGQVYITYRSRPSGCVFVTLSVYGVERCINGKIDGLDDPTTTDSTQSPDVQTTDSPVTAIDPTKSTDIDVPEGSETNLSATTEIDIPGETGTESAQSTEADIPEQTETDIPPIVDTTNGGIEMPSLTRTSWRTWANTSFTTPPIAETSRDATTTIADSESSTTDQAAPGDESTTAAENLESSTTLTATLESTIGDATSSAAETTTTTQGPTVTSLTRNGNFAVTDQSGGLYLWEGQGVASQRDQGCYTGDGSTDSGCLSLGQVGAIITKRGLPDTEDLIKQTITGLSNEEESSYTLQFYYSVQEVDGASCKLEGIGGITGFFDVGLVDGDTDTSWKRAVGTVVADVTEADVTIRLVCEGGSQAIVFVDSVFVSNEVTEANISEYELVFGEETGPGNGQGR